ncbi:MAG: hypothetical protein ICV80_15765 [Microcoleus sp. T1-bin1]|nr:hypothetical protein [Microcoleus sp. T1-bin1]
MVKNYWGVPILMVCGVLAVEFLCGIDSSFSSHQQFEYKVFVPLPWEPSASESFETRDFPKLIPVKKKNATFGKQQTQIVISHA